MHIGSGPGVSGLSAMHVNPFVPLRTVRIFPSASIATMVASFATPAGAAVIALLMISASLIFAAGGADPFVSAPFTLAVNVIVRRPIRKQLARLNLIILLSSAVAK